MDKLNTFKGSANYFRSKFCFFWTETPEVFHFQLFCYSENKYTSTAFVLLKQLHRFVLCCKMWGDRWADVFALCLSLSHQCLIFSFVFVSHVQFCKAKSRCTLSQVVHQQHSVTVSYHSLLQYSPPLCSSASSLPFYLSFLHLCSPFPFPCLSLFPAGP